MSHAFHVRWRATAGGILTSTIAAGETVCATVQDHEILALDGWTGDTRWRFSSLLPITTETAGAGTLYAGCEDGTIVALDIQTGVERWRVRAAGENASLAHLDVVDGTLIGVMGAPSSTLLALETERGEERWRSFLGETPCHAAGSGVVVYAGNDGQTVVNVEPRTGEERWRRDAGNGLTTLAVSDDTCFACTTQGTIIAFTADTGDERWRTALELEPWNVLVAHGVMMGRGWFEDGREMLWALRGDTGAILWTIHGDDYGVIVPFSAGLDGTAHFIDDTDVLYTLAVATGEERGRFTRGIAGDPHSDRWRWRSPKPAVLGTLTITGSDDGTIRALEPVATRERWRFRAGHYIESSAPTTSDGVVYACWNADVMESGTLHAMPAWTGTVHALAANTGAVLWTTRTGGAIRSSPVVADGCVYVGCLDLNLYCLDAASGEMRWRFGSRYYQGESPGGFMTTPIVRDGVVYATGEDEFVYALDATTGAVRWRLDTESTFLSNPALSGETLVVATSLHGVLGLDAATGRERWRWSLGQSFRSPTIADGVVYLTSVDRGTRASSAVHALDADTGIELWRVTTPLSWDLPPYPAILDEPPETVTRPSLIRIDGYHPSQSHPVVANGVVYALSEANAIYALDALTGSEHWRFTTGEPIRVAPLLADGVLYVAGDDCNLYAVDPATGAEHWRFATWPGTTTPAVGDGMLYVGSVEGLYALEPGALPGRS
jgi:outer membrane protein assembly factor BamB